MRIVIPCLTGNLLVNPQYIVGLLCILLLRFRKTLKANRFPESYCSPRRVLRASSLAHYRAAEQATVGCNPQCIVECFQGGHPLGTRLNTGFQKAFFNQPVLSTTSRRLFLEEFSLTRWYNERWPNRFLPSFWNYCSKVLPWHFLYLKYTSFLLKNRENCPLKRRNPWP